MGNETVCPPPPVAAPSSSTVPVAVANRYALLANDA
jgi:hypothetical protein